MTMGKTPPKIINPTESDQAVAADCMNIIKKRTALNDQEQRLLDALYAEIGIKYELLPPQEGFKIERFDEKTEISKEWF
jgi:hypothetical protein